MAFQSNAFQNDAFQIEGNTCTFYDDLISYNAPINYNGVCAAPPQPTPTGNPKGGGLIINVYERIDPYERKRRREDEEILIL